MNSRTPSRANSVTVSASSPGSIAGHTRYIVMLLEVDHMPWVYNIIASVAHWVLLAGYLVKPGTFTTLQKSEKLEQALIGNGANKAVLNKIQNLPLLAIACVFFAVGTALLTWLCWKWRSNYIWLVGRVFMPVAMNAAAGLATTLINVYTAQSATWSIMALVTTVMVGSAFFFVSSSLTVLYKYVLLKKVEKEHEMEMRNSTPTSTDNHS
ncbi:hypothetical protein CBS63078_11275 [Aspergillus niger]|nr:hypothetical protein CBS13152_10937 [Aspergillus niger]KAI2868642.1 hypothetical protein CBS11852_11336 [Aspergillus niger]KAI2885168.1 hypothetical protein CBS63078_11275 [Aspergillus niger]KAI3014842.1 hypothetical protein CBS147347_11379 [Aspergillus niger]KAI3033482.1 hypothetical protein CBS76997_11286 [Aspergillus niger]